MCLIPPPRPLLPVGHLSPPLPADGPSTAHARKPRPPSALCHREQSAFSRTSRVRGLSLALRPCSRASCPCQQDGEGLEATPLLGSLSLVPASWLSPVPALPSFAGSLRAPACSRVSRRRRKPSAVCALVAFVSHSQMWGGLIPGGASVPCEALCEWLREREGPESAVPSSALTVQVQGPAGVGAVTAWTGPAGHVRRLERSAAPPPAAWRASPWDCASPWPGVLRQADPGGRAWGLAACSET